MEMSKTASERGRDVGRRQRERNKLVYQRHGHTDRQITQTDRQTYR